MASNETIQNLATLLGALKDYNAPRREMENYAKKALIDFNLQKKLMDYKKEETDIEGIESTFDAAEESLLTKKLDAEFVTPREVQRGMTQGRRRRVLSYLAPSTILGELGQALGAGEPGFTRRKRRVGEKDISEIGSGIVQYAGIVREVDNARAKGVAIKKDAGITSDMRTYKQLLDRVDYGSLSSSSKDEHDLYTRMVNTYLAE